VPHKLKDFITHSGSFEFISEATGVGLHPHSQCKSPVHLPRQSGCQSTGRCERKNHQSHLHGYGEHWGTQGSFQGELLPLDYPEPLACPSTEAGSVPAGHALNTPSSIPTRGISLHKLSLEAPLLWPRKYPCLAGKGNKQGQDFEICCHAPPPAPWFNWSGVQPESPKFWKLPRWF
jgi:hypothetical protein